MKIITIIEKVEFHVRILTVYAFGPFLNARVRLKNRYLPNDLEWTKEKTYVLILSPQNLIKRKDLRL